MEQLVILVIIGLISLVNWLLQKAAEKREAAKLKKVERGEQKSEERRNIYTQPPPVPASTGRRPSAPAQDPFKDLMDALGLPSDGAPPVVRREATPPPVVEVEEFASLEEPPPRPQHKQRRAKQPQVTWKQPEKKRQPDEKEARLASAFAAQEGRRSTKGSPDRRPIRTLLSDRSSQRQAVILSEILGRPRAFLPPDEWMTVPGR